MYNQDQVQQQLINVRQIQGILDRITSEAGTEGVYLVEESGFLIAEAGNIDIDRVALAALVAASFGATTEIAKLLGEESFTQLTQQGKDSHLFICKAGSRHIVIAAFGKETNLGLVKLYVEKAVIHLGAMLDYVPPTLTKIPVKTAQAVEEQPSMVLTDEEFMIDKELSSTAVQEREELATPEEIEELEAGLMASLTEDGLTEQGGEPTDNDSVVETLVEETAPEEPAADESVVEEVELGEGADLISELSEDDNIATTESTDEAEVDIEAETVEELTEEVDLEEPETEEAIEEVEEDIAVEAEDEHEEEVIADETEILETTEEPAGESDSETALEAAERVAVQLKEMVDREESDMFESQEKVGLEQDETEVGDTDKITGETTEDAESRDKKSEFDKLKEKGFIDIPALDEDEEEPEADETIDLDVDKELEKLLEEGIVKITGIEEDVLVESEEETEKQQPDAAEIEITDEETDPEIERLTVELRQEIAQLRSESEQMEGSIEHLQKEEADVSLDEVTGDIEDLPASDEEEPEEKEVEIESDAVDEAESDEDVHDEDAEKETDDKDAETNGKRSGGKIFPSWLDDTE
ncbi:roadblock/LC7 domain-containing protein [bacterium]|nr:roadblock/LC7 domain-containing protein [bacterium]